MCLSMCLSLLSTQTQTNLLHVLVALILLRVLASSSWSESRPASVSHGRRSDCRRGRHASAGKDAQVAVLGMLRCRAALSSSSVELRGRAAWSSRAVEQSCRAAFPSCVVELRGRAVIRSEQSHQARDRLSSRPEGLSDVDRMISSSLSLSLSSSLSSFGQAQEGHVVCAPPGHDRPSDYSP